MQSTFCGKFIMPSEKKIDHNKYTRCVVGRQGKKMYIINVYAFK